jgi:hypothetical protein
MRRPHALAAASLALLSGCASANITVTPSGKVLDLAARKPDCVVEFHRARPPERPFDEIATLHLEGARVDAWEAQERMRARACALGADAVVVLRDYVRAGERVAMTGTAVSYPEVRADAGALLARDERGIGDLMPPPGFSLAVVKRETPLRSATGADAVTRGVIAAGTGIWAEKPRAPDLPCRVRHPDGREGWADCAALDIGAKPEARPSESAPPPPPPAPTPI